MLKNRPQVLSDESASTSKLCSSFLFFISAIMYGWKILNGAEETKIAVRVSLASNASKKDISVQKMTDSRNRKGDNWNI